MRFEDLDGVDLIGYLPEALFLMDFDGNVLDANPEACKLLGYEKEELLERKVGGLVSDSEPVIGSEEAARSESAETSVVRKEGTEIPPGPRRW